MKEAHSFASKFTYLKELSHEMYLAFDDMHVWLVQGQFLNVKPGMFPCFLLVSRVW